MINPISINAVLDGLSEVEHHVCGFNLTIHLYEELSSELLLKNPFGFLCEED